MKHNWKHIKFGDAFNLQMGKTPTRANSAYWSNGLYDWVSISDMPNGKYIQGTKEKISQKAVDETGIHLVKKGTALMSFKLTIGKTAIAPYDLYTNEAIMAFEPKDGTDVLADFLYYYLQLYEWDGNRAVMGNTTNKGVISNSYAYIPSLSEQESIVAELDAINHLIDLQEKQLREYDRLAQSLFYSTFGDPVSNPKGWEVKKLGEVCRFLNGDRGVNYPSAKDFVAEGIPFINAGHLQNGKICFEDMNYISKERFDLLHAGKVQKDDILFCLRGSLGKFAIVDFDDFGAIASSLVIIRSLDVAPLFIVRYLQTSAVKEQIERANNGSSQPNLSAKSVADFKLPLPPLALQQSFAAQIEAIEQQKALIRRSLDETRTLLAARMQYYFE